MNELGVPLGLLSQTFYEREAESLVKNKENTRKKTPFIEKESYRWLEQFNLLQETYKDEITKTIIQICDREADIHEVLQARKYDHIQYIIRSAYDRTCPDNEQTIWKQVENEPFAYRYELNVPEGKERTARIAQMEVRYKQVTIKASYRKDKSIEDQCLYILETKEVSCPVGEDAIHWRLLTSIPITSTDLAGKIIQYYVLRWVIERFHYVLKQGLKAEELQIENKIPLQNAIILKSWVALNVMNLAYTSKTAPTITLQQAGFEYRDYEIAYSYAKKRCNTKEVKQATPSVLHFSRLIAQIGGHSLQANKPIGIVSFWRGWNILSIVKDAILAIQDSDVGNQ